MDVDGDLYAFADQFRRLVNLTAERLPLLASDRTSLAARLAEHVGTAPQGLPVVVESYPGYDHANVHLAMTEWSTMDGRAAELIGIGGNGREHHSLSDLVQHEHFAVGAVDYASVPVGVDRERTCVQLGVYLLTDGAVPIAVAMRGPDPRSGFGVRLEVLTHELAVARRFLAEIRSLMHRLNVYRGQVLSFESHEFGHGVGPLRFHQRPRLDMTDVVLPGGVLDAVERQVVGVAEHRDRLRAAGHALKRGVLLFGPPGTGKTHTVRYLLARLPEFTAVIVSGLGLRFVQEACALARLVAPALVVLEDIDLIAEARSMRPGLDNPLLFQVLNEMDGLAHDADVAFLLTTNRADLLEPAFAQRPGRVDLAVEIPLPDPAARRALLALYGRGLALTEAGVDEIVARTAGTAASFFAELARRAELIAAVGGGTAGAAEVDQALDELAATRDVLLAARVPQAGWGPAAAGRPA